MDEVKDFLNGYFDEKVPSMKSLKQNWSMSAYRYSLNA
jgi:hypothetical protein